MWTKELDLYIKDIAGHRPTYAFDEKFKSSHITSPFKYYDTHMNEYLKFSSLIKNSQAWIGCLNRHTLGITNKM